MNRFYEIIKDKKYVSFDIFDTLVRRVVSHPHEVFSIMEGAAQGKGTLPHKNFKESRVRAEKEASRDNPFYNVHDIYDKIEGYLSNLDRERALNYEIQAELELCVPNPEMVEAFQYCINEGKYVIIISDMYLPKRYIELILDKCGVRGFKKLYVSCDCAADKRSGSLYRKVLDDLKIQPKELVHIGDNFKSDFLRSKVIGIHSVLYEYKSNDIYTVESRPEAVYKNQQSFINSMIDNKYKSRIEDVSFRLGYIGLGPLLFGFSKWLEERLAEDGIDKVFFLSRDGKIMETAYEAIKGSVEHQYLYASRKALIVPTLWKNINIEDALQIFFTSSGETINSLLQKLGLPSVKYTKQLDDFGLKLDDEIDFNNIQNSKFAAFYSEIKEEVFNNSKSQFKLLKEYLRENGFEGKVGIVDIGWFGNMQRAICEVVNTCEIDADVHGYYIGIHPDSKTVDKHNLNVRGYLFEKGRPELRRIEKSINAIIEFIFTTTHGSVIGYEKETGNSLVTPILDNYEYNQPSCTVNTIDPSLQYMSGVLPEIVNEDIALKSIQNAALKYIQDMNNFTLFNQQFFSPDICFSNLVEFGLHPQKMDLDYMGGIRFVGVGSKERYFAKPKSFIHYIKNVRELKDDLKYSGWRIGFLTKLFQIPLPYAEMYFKFRDVIKKVD